MHLYLMFKDVVQSPNEQISCHNVYFPAFDLIDK